MAVNIVNLKDMLRPSLAAIDVRVNSWEEAIRVCGSLLTADGAAEERFTDAMIRVAKEFGPYIVVAPGIALPHARPDDGVIKASLAVVKLRTPVYFGNKENDPVWLVVALAVKDASGHIKALAELADVLGVAENVTKLQNCATVEELIEVFYTAPSRD